MSRVTSDDLEIEALGRCEYASPLAERLGHHALHYVGRADRVLLNDNTSKVLEDRFGPTILPSFELAGPRDSLYFDPTRLVCGIVTCGGLCPGLNNVVRGLVVELSRGYGVQRIIGFRYGYEGLAQHQEIGLLQLTPEVVAEAHHKGGTLLGSSRGNQDPSLMVDQLQALGVGVLFVIGGDGTFRGAMSIVEEVKRRRIAIAVVGVPKTIDNDIHFIDRSFGFETAFSAAVDVIHSAHVEATGARNGIGLVKLMGRHSGFIACYAALASTDVDIVLIPEVPVRLDGERGLLSVLEERLQTQRHAVVVVAEGAGQELFRGNESPARDASGNVRLADIGGLLRERIQTHFQGKNITINLKYIDPSYHIRSVPASASDSVYCWNLARNAVHAALAGNTNMLIGRWHGSFVHVPMSLATRFRKQVDREGDLWAAVVESTGQPFEFG
ncbi:MAG: ATP-dependent 6-phosphofructokinase [Gammaproteobacteria bacterium]|nr:ATP-dependent 6-phosphofructokinase [Gammaproteobacteria bacterium]